MSTPLNKIHTKRTNVPLVSVVIPAYRAAEFIERTLQSVLNQTYSNFEVVVVDDGSTDNTIEVVDRLASHDARIRLLNQAHQGTSVARNFAIMNARGEFIACLDSDDIWLPTYLEKQVSRLQSAPDTVGLSYSWSLDIDRFGQPTGQFHASSAQGDVYRTLLYQNFIANASAFLIRSRCFETVGRFDPSFQFCDDYDFNLKLAFREHFVVVPEFLVLYRRSANSKSSTYSSMKIDHEHRQILSSARRSHPEIYGQSRSRHCIYLAWRSVDLRDFDAAAQWLSEALASDFLATVLRADFYRLLIAVQRLRGKALSDKPGTNQSEISTIDRESYDKSVSEFCRKNKLRIKVHAMRSLLIHQLLAYA